MIFSGFNKTDLVNYPGNVAATVFLKGCNFRCPYCHNPSLVLPDEFSDEQHDETEILDYVTQRKAFIDALVITGGEPTLYDELPQFILQVKTLGVLVKLDTNGTNPQMLEFLLKSSLIDYVAMDIKATKEKYELFVHGHCPDAWNKIMKSISLLRSSGIEYEFRTTSPKDILTVQDFEEMARIFQKNEKWYLQSFNPRVTLNPEFSCAQSYTEEELKEIAETLKNRVDVSFRG